MPFFRVLQEPPWAKILWWLDIAYLFPAEQFFSRSHRSSVGMHTTTLQRRMERFRLIIDVFLYKV